ncbi:serine kinase [Dyadobacter sp. NIV53]|uniref:serine kinase n=1 Tax=Dyadobacter sp. NIV53 TaxID=2861765 RepID=UPI001E4CE9AB|nr:serine kinase [Dyadobacter sp. NIV53]
MHYYKAFGLHINSEIELPELSSIEPQALYDLQIKIGPVVLPQLKKTLIYRRGIRAGFGQDNAGILYLNWDGVGNYSATNGNLLILSPLTTDPNLLSLFTVSEALGLILFQRGYFLLHASSVQVGNEAWCFMGSPGAGKSTTAAAFVKMGCKLLSDDLTAIGFNNNGEPMVIPAYPQLKIWEKTVNGLQYDKSELQPVSEGVNKFSYQPKIGFTHEPIRLKEIFFYTKHEIARLFRH